MCLVMTDYHCLRPNTAKEGCWRTETVLFVPDFAGNERFSLEAGNHKSFFPASGNTLSKYPSTKQKNIAAHLPPVKIINGTVLKRELKFGACSCRVTDRTQNGRPVITKCKST